MKLLILAVSLLSVCYGQDSNYARINKIKIDTTNLVHYKLNMSAFALAKPTNSIVARIDTNNTVTIPRGWQWIVVMRDNELWFIDSTKTGWRKR